MKRSLFALVLLLVLLLSACSPEPASSVYTVEMNNQNFTVDRSAGTIQCDGETYQFSVSATGASRKTTITYPDGSSYYWTDQGNGGFGGWSERYDPERYIPGDVLLSVWDYAKPATRERSGNPAVGILCLILGLVNLIFPKLSWFFRHGWAFRDTEPSDLALGIARVSGAVVAIVGIILIIV